MNVLYTDGHAPAAEQKIKVIKEKLTAYIQGGFSMKNKHQILNDIVFNINQQNVEKYGISPNILMKKLIENPHDVIAFNNHRLSVVKKSNDRRERMFEKEKMKKTTVLRRLKINDIVLIPKGRIKKSDYPTKFNKPTTNKKPYFMREHFFKIVDIKKNGTNVFYFVKALTKIVKFDFIEKERFVRDELYALKNNEVSKKVYKNAEEESR